MHAHFKKNLWNALKNFLSYWKQLHCVTYSKLNFQFSVAHLLRMTDYYHITSILKRNFVESSFKTVNFNKFSGRNNHNKVFERKRCILSTFKIKQKIPFILFSFNKCKHAFKWKEFKCLQVVCVKTYWMSSRYL